MPLIHQENRQQLDTAGLAQDNCEKYIVFFFAHLRLTTLKVRILLFISLIKGGVKRGVKMMGCFTSCDVLHDTVHLDRKRATTKKKGLQT